MIIPPLIEAWFTVCEWVEPAARQRLTALYATSPDAVCQAAEKQKRY